MTTTDASSPTSDSITAAELADPPRRPEPDDRRCPPDRRLQRLATAGRATAAAIIPGAVAFPVAWLRSVDAPEIDRLLAREGRDAPTARVVVYGDDARGRRHRPRPPRSSWAIGDVRVLDRGVRGLGRRSTRCRSSGCPHYERLVHIDWLRQLLDGGRPEALRRRRVSAAPRQLRRARGVRRGPPARRALPRHQPARGPGRLEPTVAGGDRGHAAALGIAARHDRRSSTAATPSATPTRSGRVDGRARSPRRARP